MSTQEIGGDSVFREMALAAGDNLKIASYCFKTDTREAREKQAIQAALQAENSLEGKKDLITFLKKIGMAAHISESLYDYLTGTAYQIDEYQNKLDNAVQSYKNALQKLEDDQDDATTAEAQAASVHAKYEREIQDAKNIQTHWYEPWTYAEKAALYAYAGTIYAAYGTIKGYVAVAHSGLVKDLMGVNASNANLQQKKAEIEKKIKALIDKKGHATLKDLKALQEDLKEYVAVIKQEVADGIFSKTIQDLNSDEDTTEGNAANAFFQGKDGKAIGDMGETGALEISKGILSFVNHFGSRNLLKDTQNLNSVSAATATTMQDILQLVGVLVRVGQNALNLKLQQNFQAMQTYSDKVKGSQEISRLLASAV